MDDFGTGQSSLSYLKHLPVSTVKIDRDFTNGIGTNPADAAYLRSIVSAIKAREKRIVIEGVAGEKQVEVVRELPVDYLQGFYFAKPMPLSNLFETLAHTSHLPFEKPHRPQPFM